MELCEWLTRDGLVSDGQLSDKAAGMALGELVPPSLHAMVQSEIDQLPPAPSMVLRCASVLGMQFDTAGLLGMVDAAVASDEETLGQRLQALESAHLIERVGRYEYTSSTEAAVSWKVRRCRPLRLDRRSLQ